MVRALRRRQEKPEDVAKKYCQAETDPEGFTLQKINDLIGYGVFCTKNIADNGFVLEYAAECLKKKDGIKREKKYKKQNKGCFLFFYGEYCFDATESTRLGRYCNDSPFPNTKIKFVKDCGYKLCLFATRDINPMEEIVYDYGDSNLWWREKRVELVDFTLEYRRKGDVVELLDDVQALVKSKGCDEERSLDVLGGNKEVQTCLDESIMKNQFSVNDDQTLAKTKGISTESNSDVLKGKEEIQTSLEKLSMKDQSSVNGVQTQVEKTKGLDIERKLDVLGCKEEIQISLEGPNMKDQSSVNDDQTLAKTKEISIESNSDVLKGKEEIETSLEKLSMKDQSSGNNCRDVQMLAKTKGLIESNSDVLKGKEEIKTTSAEPNQSPLNTTILNDSGVHGDFPTVSDTDDDDTHIDKMEEDEDSGDDDKDSDFNVSSETISSETEFSTSSDYEYNRPVSPSHKEKKSCQPSKIKKSDLLGHNAKELSSSSDDLFDLDIPVSSPKRKMLKFDKKQPSKKPALPTSLLNNKLLKVPALPSSLLNNNDDKVITVPVALKTEEGDRIYDRRHYCLYCGEASSKIGRHLEKHKNEPDIVKLISLDKKNDKKERSSLIDKIRFRGDFYQNLKVLELGGELIVYRRPAEGMKVSYKDYVPCKHCLAFLFKDDLWRHVKKCEYRTKSRSDDAESEKRCQYQAEMLLFPNRAKLTDLELEEFVVRRMRRDEITDAVLNDRLILTYGSFLLSGKGARKSNYISQNMRLIGRLLIALKQIHPDKISLIGFLQPQYFDAIMNCTKDLAGYSLKNEDGEAVPSFKIPSLPLKMGYALDTILMLLKGIGLREKNDLYIRDSDNLLSLYKSEWHVKLSSASLRTLGDNKFNKQEFLPVTSDLLKLKVYCEERTSFLVSALKDKHDDLSAWRELAEVVITRITVFNKRRGNEASSLLLKKYTERKNKTGTVHDDILKSLTPLERKLMNRLDLVHVRGKRGRQVPVLLLPDVVVAIDTLISTREAIGISDSNRFLFPTPSRGSKNPLRGYVCISNVTKKIANLESPERITSTKLRKYVATVAQITCLNDTEMEWLSNHLGHSVEVHKNAYRLHDSAVELAKVSRLLMAVDSGHGGEMSGKKLSEIAVAEMHQSSCDEVPDSCDNEEVKEMEISENEETHTTYELIKKLAPKTKNGRNWTGWSDDEKKLLLDSFHKHIIGKSLPGKAECLSLIANNEMLQKRSWTNLKDWVRNYKRKTVPA
ncbi:uncharacterized protein LOC130614143 isoform X3 [Hydractinia symbiolongicarpus]|uniref:uncharacterized protein LOC130614143 isoform X3 n=1 Tax=Hydractinia symbiolongicarpus TaxID=13093 RepID=UPI00254B54E5|nr:uncharacterized protein LOC130614143 isoform X3 [Hydractinia symbiolongicarpus]